MGLLLGFLVAAAVGLTGVGAGSITAPALILFLGLSPTESVGTALIFAAVIKLAVMPIYLARKQVSFRILTRLCAGGIPGVILGFWFIGKLDNSGREPWLFLLLGGTILFMSLYTLYRSAGRKGLTAGRDRAAVLPLIAAGIGTEVGFSSAGAGALGSVALLNFTSLSPAQVVGTDMLFGLVVSIVGGGLHFSAGHYDALLLWQLIAGGIAGAFLGANLSSILPARPLRMALAVWLAALGAELCWRALA